MRLRPDERWDLWFLALLALGALAMWLVWAKASALALAGVFVVVLAVKLGLRRWRWFPSKDPENYR
ncbi:MAG: hypothetical protein ACRDKY_01160 [Solirubrobacteraceae bacterium]